MSLTENDLQSIKEIVDLRAVKTEAKVEKIVEKIVEEKVEAAKRQTAKGFAEVHEKFDEVYGRLDRLEADLGQVKDTVGRIELQQRAHSEQLDHYESRLKRTEVKLKLKVA